MYQDRVIVTSTIYFWNRFCPNQERNTQKTQYEIKIWQRANMYSKSIINVPRSGNCGFNDLFLAQNLPKPRNTRKTQYEIKIWIRANMYSKPIIDVPRSGNCVFNVLFPHKHATVDCCCCC